jgi:hypothetical protein
MILVFLNINGTFHYKECKRKKEAKEKVSQWLKEAKENFPNGKFIPTYYKVVKKE